jgi:hypothetical protein
MVAHFSPALSAVEKSLMPRPITTTCGRHVGGTCQVVLL